MPPPEPAALLGSLVRLDPLPRGAAENAVAIATLLNQLGTNDPNERARALHEAGWRLATCNCEQYDKWRDAEEGWVTEEVVEVFTANNSYIFGDIANGRPTIITNYYSQWAIKVASCSTTDGDCADWTFTNDLYHPYWHNKKFPANLVIVPVEMADRSDQVFYNTQLPLSDKLGKALRMLRDSGLYDYSFRRYKNNYVRSAQEDAGNNPYINGFFQRDLDETPEGETTSIDASTFSFAEYLFANAHLSDDHVHAVARPDPVQLPAPIRRGGRRRPPPPAPPPYNPGDALPPFPRPRRSSPRIRLVTVWIASGRSAAPISPIRWATSSTSSPRKSSRTWTTFGFRTDCFFALAYTQRRPR